MPRSAAVFTFESRSKSTPPVPWYCRNSPEELMTVHLA